MNELAHNTLTQRLDRLERENRWWKMLGIATMAVLGLVLLVGATGAKVADEVRAKQFVLVDAAGKTRAKLSVWASGGSHLQLTDLNGRVRARLGVAADGGPRLYLYDQNGKRRVTLVVVGGVAPSLNMYDQTGQTVRLGMAVAGDGTPVLDLRDRDGKVIWKAP